MSAPIDLDRLARESRAVLKAEPAALVELLGAGADAVVRKTYRNRGLRLLQTFARRSRAEREFANLRALAAAGVPCVAAVQWSARRRLGFVAESALVTRFLPQSRTLKEVLVADAAAGDFVARRRLAAALGRLFAVLHRAGLVWCTPMPRNVLVRGPAADARLSVCDVPFALACPAPVHGEPPALLDLYDAAFSPSRRRNWSSPERWRCVLAYAGGDRELARSLWRRLARRTMVGHRIRRNLAIVLRTYILPAKAQRRTTTPNEA